MKRTNTYDCKHKYEMGKVLPGVANCKKCGLLKSTIEGKVNPEGVGEWREEWHKFAKENDIEVSMNGWTPPLKIIEQFIRQALLQEKAKWKEKIIEKYGKEGSFSGSFGYQGILMGVKSFQTETDKVRDEVLTLIDKL